MSRDQAIRWGWLKGMYVYTIIGAGALGVGILAAPELTRTLLALPPQDEVISFGITGSVYLSFALLSVLGLRSPLEYAPLLLLQLTYKTVWVVAVVVPRVFAGTFPGYAALTLAVYATYIVGDLVAIPFSHLFSARTGSRPRHDAPSMAGGRS